jgi:hypothetical protein
MTQPAHRPLWIQRAAAILAFTAHLAASDPLCPEPPSGQVGWWAGDGSPADSMGGPAGIVEGWVDYVPGVAGKAFRFTGGGESAGVQRCAVELVGHPELQSEQLTVAAWIRRADLTTASAGPPGSGTIFSGGREAFDWGMLASGELYLGRFGAVAFAGEGRVTDSLWHHLAMTIGDGVARFYIDGEAAGEQAPTFQPAASSHYAIGAVGGDFSGYSFGFLGEIDDVRFFNRVLTPDEIRRTRALATASCRDNLVLTGSEPRIRLPGIGSAPLTLQVTNEAGKASPGAAVSMRLPDGMTVANAEPSSGTVAIEAGRLVWSVGTVPARGASSCELSLSAIPEFRANLVAVMEVGGADVEPSDNEAVCLVTGNNACLQLPKGATAWWRGESSLLINSIVPEMLALSRATTVPGLVGDAYRFIGEQAFSVSPGFNYNVAEFTLEAWVRRGEGSGNGSDPSGDGVIFAGGLRSLAWGIRSNNIPYLSRVGEASVDAGAAITGIGWHHVAVTFENEVVRFYVDGQPAGTSVFPGKFEKPQELGIGQLPGHSPPGRYRFRGDLDELTLYERALGAAEIAAIHAAGSLGKCDDDIAVYGTGPQSVAVGDSFPVQWKVSNSGNQPENDVRLVHIVPAGLKSVDTSTSQGTSSTHGNRVEVELGRLDVGADATIEIKLQAVEPTGTFNLSAVVISGFPDVSPLNSTARVEVATGLLSVALESATAIEGASRTHPLWIPVRLSVPSTSEVTVEYSIEEGTESDINGVPAKAGEDFAAHSGHVVFAPGSTTAMIPVEIPDDNVRETLEYFWVRLISTSRGTLGWAAHKVRLFDNEPVVELRVDDPVIPEGAHGESTAEFVARLSGPAGFPLSFHYTVTNGTARVGTDYRASSGTFVMPPGATEFRLPVTIFGDTIAEPNESFQIRVVAASSVASHVNAVDPNGFATIVNDDFTPVPVAGFRWENFPPEGPIVGKPFTARLVAVDPTGAVATGFDGAVSVAAYAGDGGRPVSVLITELRWSGRTGDGAEFQNLGTNPISLGGWKATFYDTLNWPTPAASLVLPSSATVAGKGIFTITEGGGAGGTLPAFGLGVSLDWLDSTGPGPRPFAVLLQDAEGRVVDFVGVNGAEASQINLPLRLAPGDWFGPPLDLPASASAALGRKGDRQTRRAADWTASFPGFGNPNSTLRFPFVDSVPIPGSATILQGFVGGVWEGLLRIDGFQPSAGWFASDGNGHAGVSSVMPVRLENDLEISSLQRLSGTPGSGAVVRWRATVHNPGPDKAVGVKLIMDPDPRDPLLSMPYGRIRGSTSQGTVTVQFSGSLLADLGDLAAGASADVDFQIGPMPLEI